MIEVRFRPMPLWPYPSTPSDARASRHHFKAGWQNTLNLLEREIRWLRGDEVTIGVGLLPRHIRNDGWPRGDAPQPAHPGAEVSFEAWIANRSRRITYATDLYPTYQHNVRAIGLALEALRAVDRHGVTRQGEQYAGFTALPPGAPTAEQGLALIRQHGGLKEALHSTHPDHGGDAFDFACVMAAKDAGLA